MYSSSFLPAEAAPRAAAARTFAATTSSWLEALRRIAHAVGARIVEAGEHLQRHREQRARYLALMQLDERTLRDLGLCRSELSSVARGDDETRMLRR